MSIALLSLLRRVVVFFFLLIVFGFDGVLILLEDLVLDDVVVTRNRLGFDNWVLVNSTGGLFFA